MDPSGIIGEQLQHLATFPGFEASKQAVTRAKETVHQYRRRSRTFVPCAPQPEDPPPPYSVCPPYNPSFRPGGLQQAYYAEPSSSHDVPDGRSGGNRRSSGSTSGLRQSLSNGSLSSASSTRVQPSSSASVASRPRRRGFFFRTSFRRSESSGNRIHQRSSDIVRPRSMPSTSRSTNPFEDDIIR